MKLLRYGAFGNERPAVIPAEQRDALDASSITDDFDTEFFSNGGLVRLDNAVREGSLPKISIEGQRIGSPIRRPGKIVCIGLNYRKHADESGMEIPKEPVIFMKAANTVVGPNDDVYIPRGSCKTDWEIELAVLIGRVASYVDDPTAASKYIAGYAISNDVSEREFQLERGGQWDKGKSCATFNPLGPWIVTADEVLLPQQLDMRLDVNRRCEQTGNTSDMIFTINYLVWYVSQFMVLEPGDIINTGTPAGVGHGKQPPRYLVPGDEMYLSIQGLGDQCSRAVSTP